MELRHLRYFREVAEWFSFSEAARRLHISQSSISEQIRDLESELGVPLFRRERSRLCLTEHGEIFLKEAREILDHAGRAVELAQRSLRGEVGTLSIGFMAWATAPFFPQIIRQYRRRFPAVRLSLHEMTPVRQREALEKGEIDIGFTRPMEMPPASLFRSERLYDDPIVAVVPRKHPLAPGPIALAALADEDFIIYPREVAPSFFDTVTAMCKDAGFSPRIANSPALSQTVLTLVEAGEGIALVPYGVRYLRPRGLAFCRLKPDTGRIGMVMGWRSDSKGTVLKGFLDLVRERKAHIAQAMLGDSQPPQNA